MSRFVLAVAAIATLTSCLQAAPIPPDGGKAAVFPYPAKAPVVVSLNGYDTVKERLGKMLAAAVPEDAEKLNKLIDEQIAKLLHDRKLTGVRKDARIFLVLNDIAGVVDGHVPVSVLVPVTSYKQFQDSFLTKDELKSLDRGRDGVDTIKTAATGEEQTLFLIDLKEYVAITPDKATADSYAGKYTAGNTEPMGKELSESFLKSDLGVYVNMDAINEQFGDQIRAFRGLIDFALQQAFQQGMIPGLNKKQLEALKVAVKGLFQAVEDCRAVVLAADIQPEGLAFRLHARFAENSTSAKMLRAETSTALDQLARLPSGLGAYGETRLGATLQDLLREMNQEFATAEDDDQGAALLDQLHKDRLAAGPLGEWSGSSAPDRSITVAAYKDAARASRAITKSYKAINPGGRVNGVILKAVPRVSEEAEKHRGFTLAEVILKYDFEATVAALPEQVKEATLATLKRTVKETTSLWIGTDGKTVVTLMAKDWDGARQLLNEYLDGKQSIGGDAAFKLTRAHLPAEASLLMIADTRTTLAGLIDGIRAASESVPGFPRIATLKMPKGDPTYVGFSVTFKGDTVGVAAFVPNTALSVGRKMFEGIFKNVE
jgi:hypothetical protein